MTFSIKAHGQKMGVFLLFCKLGTSLVLLAYTKTVHRLSSNSISSNRWKHFQEPLLPPLICFTASSAYSVQRRSYILSILQGHEVGWLDARNLCRERCMDLISIETYHEFLLVQDIIRRHNLNSIWTSGRLCNFKGCNAKHLQPRHINGW